ncbi:MAG: hypothetical protein KC493_16705, partial [Bacteriovoracaceae bacterium]|nr:hypothetical protein [Bacteriovoracaceae bacterium]
MRKMRQLFAVMAFLFSSHVVAASWNMANLHMQFYADHLWLVYQCGDYLYFNHEVRDQRRENDSSLSFSWLTHSTMIGLRYCDGFGHSFLNEKVSSKTAAQSVVLPEKMHLFYKSKSNNSAIKMKTYTGRPTGKPNKNKWSSSQTLKDNRGSTIRTNRFSAFEAMGELNVAFVQNRDLYIRKSNGKVVKVETPNPVLENYSIKAVSAVTKTGPSILIQYVSKQSNGADRYSFTMLDMGDFAK